MNEQYRSLILEEYPHRTLYLHDNQYYLGRAYAWLNRHQSMHRITQMTSEEHAELFGVVLKEYERALDSLWRPDLMNHASLGNMIADHDGHGHLHVIPRYAKPVDFGGHTFVDGQWSRNYAPYPKETTSPKILEVMVRTLKGHLA